VARISGESFGTNIAVLYAKGKGGNLKVRSFGELTQQLLAVVTNTINSCSR
jgi:hypothetical protein